MWKEEYNDKSGDKNNNYYVYNKIKHQVKSSSTIITHLTYASSYSVAMQYALCNIIIIL